MPTQNQDYTLKPHKLQPLYAWAGQIGLSGQYVSRMAMKHKVPVMRVGYLVVLDPPAMDKLKKILKC